ncbi:MnhB domain-containing protein [Thermogladius sp. 4427co]|uniref:MnhB domain-containing protein n=1 Tax=Thermogladius sp. 4427co TaxID=3450718 RepID=UPI003F791EE1
MRRRLEDIGLLISLLIGVLLTYYLVASGIVSTSAGNTYLARTYLVNVPYIYSPYTSRSPEVVTSVIWDQRGFDTYFETSVLFIAIMGLLYVAGARIEGGSASPIATVIPRVIVKIIFPVIIVVSVSVAIHGHLTPGGGFQGGSIFAVAPYMFLLIFGWKALEEKGFKSKVLIFLRSLAVTLIALTGSIILILGFVKGVDASLFQNQPKPPYSPIGYPAWFQLPWDGIFLFSGSLMILNLLEFTAVSTGFTLALAIIDSITGGRE